MTLFSPHLLLEDAAKRWQALARAWAPAHLATEMP